MLAGNVYTVTTFQDTNNVGSLRRAISDANADGNGDTIKFAITDAKVPAAPEIELSKLLGALSPIIVQVNIVGDGKTAIKAGAGLTSDGLVFTAGLVGGVAKSAAGSVLTGLTFDGFTGNGVTIDGVKGKGVILSKDTLINNKNGLAIQNGSTNTQVTQCNIGEIRSQAGAITSFATAGNKVGILISGGSNQNVIGSGPFSDAGISNFIGGNKTDGIQIVDSSENTITGNGIGLALFLIVKSPFGNGGNGISITGTSLKNKIGEAILDLNKNGTLFNPSNVISGNVGAGVYLEKGAVSTIVVGNFIGTSENGVVAVSNQHGGVYLNRAASTQIGSLVLAADKSLTVAGFNLISGNSIANIRLFSDSSTTIAGNYIGLASDGLSQLLPQVLNTALPLQNGILAKYTRDLVVGSAYSGKGLASNTISGNTRDGIAFVGVNTTARVFGNEIGRSADKTSPVANQNGISITGRFTGAIGSVFNTPTAVNGNDIDGNAVNGILVRDVTKGTRIGIYHNEIANNGTPKTATQAAVGWGILLNSGTADSILIKGNTVNLTATARNVLGGVQKDGVNAPVKIIDPNSFIGNAVDAIDIGSLGVTGLGAPVISSASQSTGNITVSGTLDRDPLTTYGMEFFGNSDVGPGGFGPGEDYLGTVFVTTDANGHADFSQTFLAVSDPYVSATATDMSPEGGTSEFSRSVAVSGYTAVAPYPPVVTALSVSSGSTAGGTVVTVTGLHFTNASEVDFGGVAAAFTRVSDTTIIATTPAALAGTVDVTVTTPVGTSSLVTADRFTYTTATIPGSISGRVWDDADGSGTMDAGEAGVVGVEADLLDSTGALLASTHSDPSGAFSFFNVAAGTYSVRFVAPGGQMFTTPYMGSLDVASLANPLTGQTDPITVFAGQAVVSIDAGLLADPGPTLAADSATTTQGTPVSIDVLGNDAAADGSPLTITAVSAAANGTVSIVGDGTPGGETLLYTPDAGFLGTDGLTYTVTDPHGLSATATVSVVVAAPATVGNRVWLDQHGTGIETADDPGVAGVWVDLLDSSGTIVDSTQTDASGYYQFAGLVPGSYTLRVETPAGYALAAQGQGTDPSLASAFDPTTGLSAPVPLAAGQVDNDLDAGLVPPPPATTATVEGWAFQDDNADQHWESNENGIANILVNLTRAGVTQSTYTDSAGFYSFAGLSAGSYALQISATGQAREGYYLDDGTPVPSASVNVTTGQTADLDAAFFAPSSAPSSTVLTASAPTSMLGQAVTFTTTVFGTGGLTPTGSVTFYDGANAIGAGTLSNGVANFATATLAAGPHTLTAIYSGDAAYAGGTSPAVGEDVLAPSTTTLTSSAQSVVVNGSATFAATVTSQTPGTPGGYVAFYSTYQANGNTYTGFFGNGIYQGNGVWTVTTPVGFFPSAGATDIIQAHYFGDSTFDGNWSNVVTETVYAASTTTSLSSSSQAVLVGGSATFTATVASTSAVSSGGTVAFYSTYQANGHTYTGFFGNGAYQGNGVWTVTTPVGFFPTAGATDLIQARYFGDANFGGSWSNVVTESVYAPASTTTTLTVSSQAVVVNGAVTFTATVTSQSPVTSGTVAFYSTYQANGHTYTGFFGNGIYQGNGVWTVTTPAGFFPSAGATDIIQAHYFGDGTFAASWSNTLAETVYATAPTTTTRLTASSQSVLAGGSVTFTATVASQTPGTPTGNVAFYHDGFFFDYGTYQGNDTWTYTTPAGFFPVGGASYAITATYGGDGTFVGSSSNAVTETVVAASSLQPSATGTVISSAGSSALYQYQAVTFSVFVSSPAGAITTGAVDFYDGTTLLGPGVYQWTGAYAGWWILATPGLAVGGHPITASYVANASYSGSSSPTYLLQTVS